MADLTNSKIKGIRVAKIVSSSPAYVAGLRTHDTILTVNDEPVEDDLDFSFCTASENLEIKVLRRNIQRTFHIIRQPGEFLGVELAAMSVSRCRNHCIFCFIDQLPDGLRRKLYVKDEDCRYSFLNGNYVTLTSLTVNEMNKIIRLGLSPLYISVHATDPRVRIKMLNNRKAGRIVSQLGTLAYHDIAFHTQIVVCPDINDGEILHKTIQDLLSFQNSLLSIAVVPVGLTKHRKKLLKPVMPENAQAICRIVDSLSNSDRKKTGVRRIFIADELFIKAGLPIPENEYYEDYPQAENGVGLIRLLLDNWQSLKKELQKRKNIIERKSQRKKHYLILTSVSACTYIQKVVDELLHFFPQCDLTVIPVINNFFGESVTVAGLISARDIIKTVRMTRGKWDSVIVPKVLLNYRKFTLDGYSTKRIEANLGTRVDSIRDLSELVACLQKECHGG